MSRKNSASPIPHHGLQLYEAIAHQEEQLTQKRPTNPYKDTTRGRPDYQTFWEKAGLISVLPQKPVSKQLRDQLIELELDLQDALLPLTPPNEMGLPPDYLRPGDLKAEAQRLVPALEKAQDLLAFCAEKLQQPPPEDLRHIEQVLRSRFRSKDVQQVLQLPNP